MKTFNLSAVLLAVAVSGTAAFAQDNPAPATAPSAPAEPAAPTGTVAVAAAPLAINGYVYVEKLPTPTQLLSDAEAEHLTITRMDQSASQIVVVYQYPDGRTRAFAYTTTAPTDSDRVQLVTPASASTATYTVVSAPPAGSTTVVYTEPDRIYYRSAPRYVRYYEPAWDFWAPLAIGVGLGWNFSGHHGHYHGGFRGHGGRRH